MKICTKCGVEKPLTDFYKTKLIKSGYVSACKICMVKKTNQYYQDNKKDMQEYQTYYRVKNKEKLQKYQVEYRRKNGVCCRSSINES